MGFSRVRGERLLAVPPLAAVSVAPPSALAEKLAQACLERAAEDPSFYAEFWSLSDGRTSGASCEADGVEPSSPKRARGSHDVHDLARALQVVAANAHRWPRGGGRAAGLGLWTWHAYMNHGEAVEANCCEIFIDDVMVVRACQEILPGQEILIPYTPPVASWKVQQAILQHCGVPHDSLERRRAEEAQRPAADRLACELCRAEEAFAEGIALAHRASPSAADAAFRRALDATSCGEASGSLAMETPVAVAQLLRLRLRAARCLGEMGVAGEAHAALARATTRERPHHAEAMAHWLAHLRAGGTRSRAVKEVRRLAAFWFGQRPVTLREAADWAESVGLGPKDL